MQHNNGKAVFRLLQHGPGQVWGEAVKEFAKCNNLEGVRLLTMAGGLLNKDERNAIVKEFARHNNLEAVLLLTKNLTLIYDDNNRGELVCEFARHNNLEAVQRLLRNEPIEGIAPGEVFRGFVRDNGEIVRVIISKRSMSDDQRSKAVEEFARHNNLEVVQLLLGNGPISDDARRKAVKEFARHNNTGAIQLLLGNGPISVHARRKAVKEFAQHNNVEAVRLLMSSLSFLVVSFLTMELLFTIPSMSLKDRLLLGIRLFVRQPLAYVLLILPVIVVSSVVAALLWKLNQNKLNLEAST